MLHPASKQERLKLANEWIRCIGDHGRRFFHREGFYASFYLDDGGRIWFVDDYTKKAIYTHDERHEWKGFSHGGTLRGLVIAMRDFIGKGHKLTGYSVSGQHWAYGDSMAAVTQKAFELGLADDEKEKVRA